MTFDLSDEQAMFRSTVERFTGVGAGAGDVAVLKRARAAPGGVEVARWQALADLGLIALAAPASHGGLDGSAVDCAIVAEALGRGLAPQPWLECGYWPLRLLARLEHGAALSAQVARGAVRVAVAFAEPALRYEMGPRETAATGSAISGVKTVVLGGEGVDLYLVTALVEGRAAVFAVAADAVAARGFSVVDGGRAVTLTLRGAAGELLGFPEDALAEAVAETRLMAAAEMVGLAGRMFDDTLAYVRQREQFGQPIGRFQAIQHRLVDCYAMLEQMRSTLWRGALADRVPVAAWRASLAGAKAFVAERALHIGHEAIQLHGGMGVTDELSIGHAHKRVVLLSKLFGDVASDLATFARAA